MNIVESCVKVYNINSFFFFFGNFDFDVCSVTLLLDFRRTIEL